MPPSVTRAGRTGRQYCSKPHASGLDPRRPARDLPGDTAAALWAGVGDTRGGGGSSSHPSSHQWDPTPSQGGCSDHGRTGGGGQVSVALGLEGCAATDMSVSDAGQSPVPHPPRYGRIAPAAHKDDFPVPQNVSPSQPASRGLNANSARSYSSLGAAWPTPRERRPSGGSPC